MFKQTALTSVDSYKLGHAEQYPPGTTKVYSNFTARSVKYLNIPEEYKTQEIVWFGLQAFIVEMDELWRSTFFQQDFDVVATDFQEIVAPFCGPNGFNIDRLKQLHDLGYLPLCIKALPEGSKVPVGVPVLTITNTLPDFYWLPNFMETWMSAELWKGSTSATISYAYRKIIEKYADFTGGSKEFIDWQGHDFSPRGMSGIKDSAKSGAGHLLVFAGTDNIPAVKLIRDVYEAEQGFVYASVPATEHSVMCAGGEETELQTFERLLDTYPAGVVAIVSDTWDYWKVITETALALKEKILNRKQDSLGLAKTVFRPDSGDPVKIIVGDPDAEPGTPAYKGSVECLAEIFGTTTNGKGYKTLNPRVGLIYGDSITPARCEAILKGLSAKGYASDNVVFGIGSYTFQYNTRDTLGFAMKATYVEINGIGKSIFKYPKTDDGTKKSAKGLLRVDKTSTGYVLTDNVTAEQEQAGELKVVYNDGNYDLESFETIRKRLNS